MRTDIEIGITVSDAGFPDWLPPSGHYGIVPMLNSHRDVDPAVDLGMPFSPSGTNGGYATTWAGAIFAEDYSPLGAYIPHSGGHGDYFGNECYVADLSTLRWSRILDPSPYSSGTTQQEQENSVVVPEWREFPDGSWIMPHTYHSLSYVPASWGVTGTKGALVKTGHPGRSLYIFTHKIDLAAPKRERFSDRSILYSGLGPYPAVARDDSRQCFWIAHGHGANKQWRLDKDGTLTERGGASAPNSANMALGYAPPPYDCLIMIQSNGVVFGVQNAEAGGAFARVGTVGEAPTEFSVNMCSPRWDSDRGCFMLWEPMSQSIFRLTPPANFLSEPWVWQAEPMIPWGAIPPTPLHVSGGPLGKFVHVPWAKAYLYWNGMQLQIIRPSGA